MVPTLSVLGYYRSAWRFHSPSPRHQPYVSANFLPRASSSFVLVRSQDEDQTVRCSDTAASSPNTPSPSSPCGARGARLIDSAAAAACGPAPRASP